MNPYVGRNPYTLRQTSSEVGSVPKIVDEYIAGQVLSGHRVVVTDANGKAIYAQNNDLTHAHASFKLTLGAALLDTSVSVQAFGRITEVSWAWTVGASLYLGLNGQLTEVPPSAAGSFSRIVAVAETATRILLVQQSPVVLA